MTRPFPPSSLAPIIGSAIIVPTPKISPFPIDFNPEDVPARTSLGFFVENKAYFPFFPSPIKVISGYYYYSYF